MSLLLKVVDVEMTFHVQPREERHQGWGQASSDGWGEPVTTLESDPLGYFADMKQLSMMPQGAGTVNQDLERNLCWTPKMVDYSKAQLAQVMKNGDITVGVINARYPT